MEEPFTTKVTKINDRWHVRLIHIEDGSIVDEMACDNKENISYLCFVMLRWADKMGWVSPMALASRKRQDKMYKAPGIIWYRKELNG